MLLPIYLAQQMIVKLTVFSPSALSILRSPLSLPPERNIKLRDQAAS